ncbi:MAG: T9SS type A sorting domain-containing protein [Hymenobacter sp.]|nr:MAG: T9SS type A sorting domain-containing protein [Hymenobacter sp.]
MYFETGATNGYDGKYDAYKLANPSGYYLGSATPGPAPLGLSIDGRAPLATVTEIPLWVSLPAGPYTFTATELLNFATLAGGTQVQLRDAQLGTLTDLATVPSYSFSVAANAATAGRFSLVFRPSGVLATIPGTALAQVSASLYPNPATSTTALSVTNLPAAVATLQVEVVDVLGRAVGRYTLPVRSGSATQSVATDQLANTLYLLRLTALDAQGQVQGTLPTRRLVLAH